ncbi:MAG TPA: hypothetical protein VHT24_10560 [Pseudacidobacterium sp.]|nr:hypothetical protein [Pseudacidobacterium sp.]
MFSQPANEVWGSNDLKQIDWSREGRYLLLELRQADLGGEKTNNGPLVFDSFSNRIFHPDILKLFQSHFHQKCANDTVIDGFTYDDDIVLTATPLEPDPIYESQLLPACLAGRTKWAVNFRENDLRQLPDDYIPLRYSQFGDSR